MNALPFNILRYGHLNILAQVAESRMGLAPPQHVGPALLPSLLTPWTSNTHLSSSQAQHSSRRSLFQPGLQPRRQQPLTRRRRPPKPTSKPKSGWNSWINISWGPKTPIWPLTLLYPEQVLQYFQPCLSMLTSQAEVVEPEPVVPVQQEVAAYSEVLPYFLTLKPPFALTVLHFLCSWISLLPSSLLATIFRRWTIPTAGKAVSPSSLPQWDGKKDCASRKGQGGGENRLLGMDRICQKSALAKLSILLLFSLCREVSGRSLNL